MNVLALLRSFGQEDAIACSTAQVIRDSCNGKQEGQSLGTWSFYIHSDEELTNFPSSCPPPSFYLQFTGPFLARQNLEDPPFIMCGWNKWIRASWVP